MNRRKLPKPVFNAKRGVWEFPKNENDVVGEIVTFLELRGARVSRCIERVPKCYRCGQWLGASERFRPDLDGYFPRGAVKELIPFWIECKRPKGGIKTAGQIGRIDKIVRDGGVAFFATSVQDVIYEFAKFGIQL